MKNAVSDVTPDLSPIDAGLGETRSIKSVLKNKLGLSASLPEVLGALAIGIIVIGGGGFGIAAGVNYSNNSQAQSALESVKSAQTLQQSKAGSFGTLEALTTGDTPPLTTAPDNLKIAATATNYCAVIKSKSMTGDTYWITAKSGKVLKAAPAAAMLGDATCPTA